MKLFKYITLSLIAWLSLVSSSYSETAWQALRQQFSLNHEISHPAVQAQIRWLTKHPGYLQALSQSKPYIYHIINEIKRHHLPGELALIPLIESAFDPFASSEVGAAGIWQIMPETAKDLGLRKDWWIDGRRSIRPSTKAALDYLSYLHKFFHGDWLLAIAAYDSGEGKLSRIIKNNTLLHAKIEFWSLPVPKETKAYIPRLLALAAIIDNPERYHVRLPKIDYVPYFKEINIESPIDLTNAAQLAGISYKELILLNPGFNHWTSAPYKPFNLLIPIDKITSFTNNLAQWSLEKKLPWYTHKVRKGEQLEQIAHHYFTTVSLLRKINQLTKNKLTPGQPLLIPNNHKSKPNKVSSKPKIYKVIHIVQNKESYQMIAKKYHVSVTALKQWNRIRFARPLKKSEVLVVWQDSSKMA